VGPVTAPASASGSVPAEWGGGCHRRGVEERGAGQPKIKIKMERVTWGGRHDGER